MKIFKIKKNPFLLFISFLFFYLFFFSVLFAQNFDLVDKEEYEEYYKKPIYVPDVRISGEYQYYNLHFSDASGDKSSTWQDFQLRIQSEIHENIKLNLLFTNEPYKWGEAKEVYQSRDRDDRKQRNRQNIGVSLRELYLEYNSNPHAVFRLGRQPINLGDKKGLIYKGEADAFSISCRLGTWCLEFGRANFGNSDSESTSNSDGIATWLEFFYPVYESEETIKNFWIDDKEKERSRSKMDVSFYRINDRQDRIALANYGGRTYNPYKNSAGETQYSPDHFQVDRNGDGTPDDYVYFDRKQETYGINFQWYNGNFGLLFDVIQHFGKKTYHYGGGDSNVVADTPRKTTGRLYRLEWEQLAGSSTKFGFVTLVASGKEAGDTSASADNAPWRSGFDYHEWNRGNYGDALIYFGGENYLGQAHSVNNLVYYSFYYQYYGAKQNFGVLTRLYSFSRKQPIYNNSGSKVTNIGWEWDLEVYKYIANSFKLSLKGAYFQPSEAYSPNDSIPPTTGKPNITQYSFEFEYKF